MIKVYLDWNCITHCKDTLSELKYLMEQYKNIFICPYSVAHLRDVQTKCDVNPIEYENDLDLLTEICGSRILLCSDNIQLRNISPREYLSDSGDILYCLQNKFPFPYASIRNLFRSAISPEAINRIAKENNPHNVFPLVNETLQRYLGISDVGALIKQTYPSIKCTLEMKIKYEYFVIDMLGYKSESKKKSFSNIDTDAQHIYTGLFYDYLISNDQKFRDKAKAIYSNNHCVTKIMDAKTFIDEIPRIIKECFDPHLILNAMRIYGTPTMEEDGAHFKPLDYPLWGTFKYCYNAVSLNNSLPKNLSIFVPDKTMFYDELKTLELIITSMLPESGYESYVGNYIQSFIHSKQQEDITLPIVIHHRNYTYTFTSYEGKPALKVMCNEI